MDVDGCKEEYIFDKEWWTTDILEKKEPVLVAQ
jgi:hypothetical protein